MTLSFHKVMFSAQEVLDLFAECDMDGLRFETRFCELAEERSRRQPQRTVQAPAEVLAAERRIGRAELYRAAEVCEQLAANYPEDVFPPDGVSRDAISGTAMRHAYRNAARAIREAARGEG